MKEYPPVLGVLIMKRVSKFGIIVALAGTLAAGTALAGPIEMVITSGTQSSPLLIGIGDPSSVAVPSSTNGGMTLNGWFISKQTGGTSYSPFLNQSVGLDLASYAVTCSGQAATGCSQDPLTIAVSATGFTSPVGRNGFQMEFSGNANGGGMATTTAYVDSLNGGNSYFCNDAGAATLGNECGASNLIGSLSLNSKSSGSSMIGGPPTTGPYSLTIVDMFTANANGVSYSADTSLVQAPEPGTLAMFGAGLLGCALFINRRRASRRS
ncbi:MAG: PEP-CTERM sorting domain-containing protein [Steroidobacteraceae bacterium]